MITATSNKRIKWLVTLSEKAKERKKEQVFLVEGIKMFEEADEQYIREVYVSESFLEKHGVSEKLQKVGYETVSDEVFKKISDTKAPQGILCVMNQYKSCVCFTRRYTRPRKPWNYFANRRRCRNRWCHYDKGYCRYLQSKNHSSYHG